MKKYLLLLFLSISAIVALSITAPAAVSYTSQFSCTLPAGIGCGELHNNVAYMSTYVVSTSPSNVLVCAGYSNGIMYSCYEVTAGHSGKDFTSDYPTSIYSFYGNIEQSYTISSTNRDFWCNCA
jgi:hypothetical protein